MPTVKVKFAGQSRNYSYTAPEGNWSVDDLAIVDSPSSGFTLTRVVSVEKADYPGNKPVVGMVSLADYKAHQERLARKAEIIAQLDRAAAEKAALAKYEFLRNDPALAALVCELETL